MEVEISDGLDRNDEDVVRDPIILDDMRRNEHEMFSESLYIHVDMEADLMKE